MPHSGERIGRYVVEAPLGRGGMGEVFVARDTALGRQVALKLLPFGSGGEARLRLLREARAAAALEHPNAVAIYDVGEHEGVPYLVLELVRGRSLRSYVGDESISLPRRLRWLSEIAHALDAAHARGLLHRDVKPDNVMVRDDGVAKVLDFGIARWRDDTVGPLAATAHAGAMDVTGEGVVVGTPLYCAPEQIRGEELDPRVDQFAWGITAYELCVGRVPWLSRDTLSLAQEILNTPVSSVPSVPQAIERVVMRALAPHRGDRFATMREVAEALEPFAEVARTGGAPGAANPQVGGARRPIVLATVALLLAAGGAALFSRTVAIPTNAVTANPPTLVVSSLRCGAAQLEGVGADDELARAIGVGTCARLGVEVGVDWNDASAVNVVDVRARLSPTGPVSVVVRVGAQEVTGVGAAPIAAMSDAVERMRPLLMAPRLDARRIAGWGALDEPEARLVERTWRRVGVRAPSSVDVELRRLLEEGHTSAWIALLLADITWPSSPERADALRRVAATSDRIPGARREAITGYAEILAAPASPDPGLARLRRAYAAESADSDISSLYAIALARYGPREETLGVLERISGRLPERSLRAFRIAIQTAPRRGDPTEVDRWSELLVTLLPEATGWPHRVLALVHRRNLDEARRALRLTERLGAEGDQQDYFLAVRAELDLASLDPASARSRARTLMGSPRDNFSAWGAGIVIAAHWMEGHGIEAQSILTAELARRRTANPVAASERAVDDLRHRRWLGQPPPPEDQLGWIESVLDSREVRGEGERAGVVAEVTLARMHLRPREAKEIGKSALAKLDARAEALAVSQRDQHDAILSAPPAGRSCPPAPGRRADACHHRLSGCARAAPMDDLDLVIHPATRSVAVNPASPNVATSVAK